MAVRARTLVEIIMQKKKSVEREDFRRARIFDEEAPVCTRENRENCYDPFSLEKAFHPLGIFTKCFGLFPCYDFKFVKKLTEGQVRIIHILDYCYSALIFLLLTGGAILCSVLKPHSLEFKKIEDRNNLDFYIKLTVVYSTLLVGIQALFMFPMKWADVLNFIQLFTNVDKILQFDGRMEERTFAKKVIIYLAGCFVFTFASYFYLFAYDEECPPGLADFLMGPIMTFGLMALIIPTGLAIFFLNAIRLRMDLFNRKLEGMLEPVLPSFDNCIGFGDYLKEEVKLGKSPEVFVQDLEKMRIIHCEIRTLGNWMSCIFGGHLVKDFLYSLVVLVLYTYFLIFFIKDGKHNWTVYAGQTVFIVMKIYVLVCFAQHISCQTKKLKGMLQRVCLRRLPSEAVLQIQVFLSITEGSANINAAGYFTINKALITSIIGSITTYFIILIQFKVTTFAAPTENA